MKKIKKVMATVLLLCMIGSMLVVPAAASEIIASEVSLNYMGKTLALGGTFQLKAAFEPEGAAPTVKWESNNTGVATVDDTGLVTGLANGTAVIKASVYEGQPFAECTVTVVTETPEVPIVPVSGISLGEQTSLNLAPYGTATLVAAVAPENATNKFVAWVSSDENVVTVDENGLVTALAAGYATVSAVAADVDLSAEDLSMAAIANCAVTVSEPYVEPAPVEPAPVEPAPVEPTPYVEPVPTVVAVNSVVIDPADLTLTAGESAYLAAYVNEDATDKSLTWASSDSNVVAVDNGAIYAVAAGYATISATANDGSGVVGYCNVTVNAPAPVNVLATAVYIDPAALTLTEGETATVSASVNAEATDQTYYWTSDNEAVAKVENGVITAVSAGTANIYAVASDNGGAYAVCAVTVNAPAPVNVLATAVYIDPAALTLTEGETATVNASVNAEATDQTYYWTSDNEAVAKVENGVVTAVSAGTANIYAVASDNGGAYAVCAVTVNEPAPVNVLATTVYIDPAALSLTEGETATVNASVNAEATDQTYYWTSDNEAVAKVENGVVTAVSAGTANIYAVASDNGGAYAVCAVTVNEPAPVNVPATAVTLEPNISEFSMKVGEYVDFTAAVNAEATDKSYYWYTDDPTVASVENGRVTAIGSGRTTIYAVATGDTAYAACTVIVAAEPVAMFAPSATTESTPQPPAPVDSSVSIVVGPLTSLSFSTVETTYTLSASLSDGSAPTSAFSWSSTGAAVSVAPAGENNTSCIVTINAVGEDTIKVSYDGLEAVDVHVSVVTDEVKMTSSTDSIIAGQSFQFKADSKYSDVNADMDVIWSSSDPNVASVDENGLVTAKVASATPVTITARSRGDVNAGRANPAFASCDITVTAATVSVSTISVTPSATDVINGESVTFTATVSPENATNKNLIWSISGGDEFAGDLTYNTDGTVTVRCTEYGSSSGVSLITVTATAENSSVSGSSSVIVLGAPAVTLECVNNWTSLTFNRNEAPFEGLSAKLSRGNPVENFVWTSSDESVVKVRNTGTDYNAHAVIEIAGVGEADITASHRGISSAPMHVTVQNNAISVTSITVAETLNLVPGGTATLHATVLPTDATNRTLNWSSDNSYVTVDNNGNVSVDANAPVNTVAYVKASADDNSGKYATCKVTVISNTVPVESVSIVGSAPRLTVGQTTSLGVSVQPSNATNKAVAWKSNNESVATVDQNGFITAKGSGQTQIVVRSVADPSKQAVIDVYVSNAPASTGTLNISASPQTISTVNGYSVLTASVNGYVINGGVNWSVSDTNMATVSSNGVVTAKRAGSFVVTGIYDNNGTRYTGTVLITAAPVITSGNYSNYDGKNVMYFKTNQSYPSWRSTDIVSVDGMQLRHGQHCYVGSSPDGYVMVALNPQYLNTLPSSVVHTIRIGPASAPAVGYFRTYSGQGTIINGVMTGDENQAALWAALCMVGILGCATILVSRRKDWN